MTTHYNHDDEAKRKEAWAFVERLKEQYSDDGYIFRGTTASHSNEVNKIEDGKIIRDGINSTLYRWVVRKEEKEEGSFEPEGHELLRRIFVENEHFSLAYMEGEIFNKAREMSQSKGSAHEILTDLQHFGGKTNMIDFSRNIYVALFFACQSKFNECGELIALHRDKFPRGNGEVEIIIPASTDNSERRAEYQESVFVRPNAGYIDPKKCEKQKIPANFKKHIMDYLREEAKIEPNTIYNDLHGFIKNAKNNETASLYFYMGSTSHGKGDNKNAIVYYRKSIEKNPNMPSTYNNLGLVHKDLREDALAMKCYDKAISLYPKYAEAHNNRGNVYSSKKEYKRAIANYDNAILSSPDYVVAYINRGIAYNALEEYKQAIADFEKAISLKSDDAEIYFNLGMVYENMRKYEQAIENFDKAISLKSDFANAYFHRGNSYGNLKQHKRAIADFDKAISITPNDAEVYFNRGLAKYKEGDMDGSVADHDKAIDLGFIPPPKK